MTFNGLGAGVRLVCVLLAVGIHAAAAAAFMLTPAIEPPAPPEGVEIELLAEITSEAAEEVAPAVAAQAAEVEPAREIEAGEAQSVTGAEVGAMASLAPDKAEVTPDEVKPVEPPDNQPEVRAPDTASPVELEKPVIAAPQAPALPGKPKPAARKTVKKKEQRRATVAGSTLSRDARRKGASRSVSSGGRQSSASYASLVQSRLAARRATIQSMLGRGTRGRVVITFSIGAGGGVRSASVTASSGNARLDSTARSVVASTSFPPPPNGSFSGRIPISVSVQ